jgi:uncharacterized membrane-anchored protein YhcB (DUF1043 family)
MWFLIPIAGLVVAGIVALASEDEKKARQSWESKHEEGKKEVQKHREEIERHLADKQKTLDFYILNDAYYTSFRTADAAYKLLQDSKESLTGLHRMLLATNAKRAELKITLNGKPAKAEKASLINELRSLTQFRDALTEDKNKVLAQKREFADEVSKLNQQTEKLKLAMRDRCGTKGVVWYAGLQSRVIEKEARLGVKT